MIPKILHQIWVGDKEFPEECREYVHGWIAKHPGWSYHLWGNADIPSLNLETQSLYDRAWCGAMKADVLRYELMYRHGGVYVDIDIECVKPFDDLLDVEFFYGEIGVCAMNGLFGCVPNHPFLKMVMVNMAQRFDGYTDLGDITGPGMFDKTAMAYGRRHLKRYSQDMFFRPPYLYSAHRTLRSWQNGSRTDPQRLKFL